MRFTTQGVASFIAVAVVASGGFSVASLASDPVRERRAAMEAVGDAMKPLAAIAKKEAPFDAAVVGKNAGIIADNLKASSALFPAGTAAGESRAKPEIWTDRAAFDKGLAESQAAAVALQAVRDEAAFGPAFAAVGVSCRSCHDKYRLPKK